MDLIGLKQLRGSRMNNNNNKTRPPFTKEERERIEKVLKKHGIKMAKPRDSRPFIMFRKDESE